MIISIFQVRFLLLIKLTTLFYHSRFPVYPITSKMVIFIYIVLHPISCIVQSILKHRQKDKLIQFMVCTLPSKLLIIMLLNAVNFLTSTFITIDHFCPDGTWVECFLSILPLLQEQETEIVVPSLALRDLCIDCRTLTFRCTQPCSYLFYNQYKWSNNRYRKLWYCLSCSKSKGLLE